MTLNNTNEQKTNGSTKKPSKEFLEKMRRGRVQLMKEYREKNQSPWKSEVTHDELTKQIETEEEAGEKRLQERISYFTNIQQEKARESIEKIESSINELKISLNGAVINLKKKKDWLISEKEKQEEINFGEIKEKPSSVLQDVIVEVPKNFSPGNMERILAPLKMKVQYQQAKLIKLLKLLDYNRNCLNRKIKWNIWINFTKKARNGRPRRWKNGSRIRFPHPRHRKNNSRYTKR
jgi:hypothetical protein